MLIHKCSQRRVSDFRDLPQLKSTDNFFYQGRNWSPLYNTHFTLTALDNLHSIVDSKVQVNLKICMRSYIKFGFTISKSKTLLQIRNPGCASVLLCRQAR